MRLSTASLVFGLFSSCASLLTAATADPPTFTPAPASSLAPMNVTLGSPTPGAEIRVTTDGSEPTEASPLAGAGISIPAGVPVVVRARAFAAGYDPSPIRAARYHVGPRVVAGRYHSLSLTTTGTLEAWGRGTQGQLGDGTTADRWMSRPVTGLSNVVELAAGGDFSAAVTADGGLWTWGRNNLGMLGLGDTANRSVPTQVAIASVRSVACGESVLLVLMQDGTVLSCGGNDMGQAGDGTGSNSSTLHVVPGLAGIVQVVAGYKHSFAVAADGTVWAWGQNSNGELGGGGWDYAYWSPIHLSTISDVVAVAAGDYHSLFLKAEGSVWATGAAWYGQLGDGLPEGYGWMSYQPAQCLTVDSAVQIAAGGNSSMALDRDGIVWTWGSSDHGQSGTGLLYYFQSQPMTLASIGAPVADISLGYHATAVTTTRDIWSWGYNSYFEVGDGSTADRTTPYLLDTHALELRAPVPTLAPDSGYYRSGVAVSAAVSAPAEARWTMDGSNPTSASPPATAAVMIPTGVPTIVRARGFADGLGASSVIAARYQRGAHVLTGRYHSLTLTEDGRLLGWGRNAYGQLGDNGADRGYARPIAVPTLRDAGAGGESSAAVGMDGSLWVWGRNDYGALGLGDVAHRYAPAQVAGIADALAVALGEYHLLVLRQDGTVWASGYNGNGQLGDGTWNNRSTLAQVAGLSRIVAIAAGNRFSLALDRDGAVWSWGENSNGQLGLGDTSARNQPILSGAARGVVALAAGEQHSIFLLQDGVVWSAGYNGYGQLGTGDTSASYRPRQVVDLTGVVSIAAGVHSSMALTRDGALWAWGNNDQGQLGDGTRTNSTRPVRVQNIGPATDVALAGHAVAATADGQVLGWGYNAYFQTGNGTNGAQDLPQIVTSVVLGPQVATPVITPVPGFARSGAAVNLSVATAGAEIRYTTDGTPPTATATLWTGSPIAVSVDSPLVLRVRAFAAGLSPSQEISGRFQVGGRATAGRQHNILLAADGTVHGWGHGTQGQLGNNSWVDQAYVKQIGGLSSAADIAAGHDFSAAVGQDGSLWTWGRNDYGILAQNDGSHRAVPTQVAGVTEARAVAGGGAHLVVLMVDGTVWASGYNGYGNLGDGSTTHRSTLVQVAGLADVVQIAAGYHHTLALCRDGTVWSWGYNAYGQLATGDANPRNQAVRIGAIADVIAVAAGDYHSLFLKADGTVWGCGYGDHGQMGNGTTGQWYLPVQAQDLTNAVSIAAGQHSSMALTRDGRVWMWGIGDHGQIGNGTTTQSTVPVAVTGITGLVRDISVGIHAVALTIDGGIWTWGYNSTYEIGDGTQQDRLTPYLIRSFSLAPQVVAPVLTPVPGYFRVGTAVSLTVATPGAEIRYTLDGSEPQTGSLLYFGTPIPVPVDWPIVIRARAFASGLHPSQETSARYAIGPRVAAGRQHSILLAADGSVFGWGHGTQGQLGNNSWVDQWYVKQIADLSGAVDIAAGYDFSAAVGQDGGVWAWGRNDYGMLGLNDTTARAVPTQVSGVTGARAVAAAGNALTVLMADGTVWNCGYNGNGNLGDGTTTNRSTLVQVVGPTDVVQIAAGYYHTLALCRNGMVWSWGYNGFGQLATGDTTNRSQAVRIGAIADVVSIAAGDHHSLFLKADGSVWAVGYGYSGQIGTGSTGQWNLPVQAQGLTNVVSIAAGQHSSMALTRDGRVWMWGIGEHGQIGNDSTGQANTPVVVNGIVGPVRDISVGIHAVALAADGGIWTWGYNGTYEIGDGTQTDRLTPYLLGGFTLAPQVAMPTLAPTPGFYRTGASVTLAVSTPGATIHYSVDGSEPQDTSPIYTGVPIPVSADRPLVVRARASASSLASSQEATGRYQIGGHIAAGRQHSILLAADGSVFGWGHGTQGQLGNNSWVDQWYVQQITGLTGIADVAAGFDFSAAVGQDGSLWSWGRNDYGMLGLNDTTNRAVPIQVPGVTGARAVAAAGNALTVLMADGTVWNCGYNGNGNLGDGTTTNRSTLVQVVGPTDVVQIAAGYYHTLALCRDGTVWSWGYNGFGQLATGDTTNRSQAVRIGAIADVVSIATGDHHSLFLKADGSVWGVGYGYSGQIGTGSTGQWNLPVQAQGLTNVVSIAAGQHSSMALTRDGRVWMWGIGEHGQIGNDSTGQANTPVVVNGIVGPVRDISVGIHAVALAADGGIWTWGYNGTYEIGDGTRDDRLTPYLIGSFTLAPRVATPRLDPVPGYYRSGVSITMSATNAAIRYTVDGTMPTGASPLWDGTPITVADSAPLVLRIRAFQDGLAPSPVVSGAYTTGPCVIAGRLHSLVVSLTGRSAGWGHGDQGQLGNATTIDRATAERVLISGAVRSLAAGFDFSAAAGDDGTLWTWGRNDYGMLGLNDTIARTVPAQVPGVTTARAVSANGSALTVLMADGTVWNCGYNGHGNLGDGTTTTRLILVPVSGPIDVVQIVSGYYHTLALCRDGTVWSWGYNGFGQLATGDTTNRLQAVRIGAIADVVSIAAGDHHSLFLKADGTVWAVGYGYDGQLGNNAIGHWLLPVQVQGLGNVVSIAAGQNSSMALTRDGRVWMWGIGEHGQIGNGTTTQSTVPVMVNGIGTQVQSISVGIHAIAASLSGEVWTWGYNNNYQIGDGSQNDRTSPYLLSNGLQRVPTNLMAAAMSPPEVQLTWTPTLSKDLVEVQRSPIEGTPVWATIGRSGRFDIYRDRLVVVGAGYRYRIRWVDTTLPWSAEAPALIPVGVTVDSVNLVARAGDDRITEGLHPVVLDGSGSYETIGTARGWRLASEASLPTGSRILRLTGGTGDFRLGDSISLGTDGIDYRIVSGQVTDGVWTVAVRAAANPGLGATIPADTLVTCDGVAEGYRLSVPGSVGATTISVAGGIGLFVVGDVLTLGTDQRTFDVLAVSGEGSYLLSIAPSGLVRAVGGRADVTVTTRIIRYRWSWTPVAGSTAILGDGARAERSLRGTDSDLWAYSGTTYTDTWGRPDGAYAVQLSVTDSAGATSIDDLTVTIQRGAAPNAAANASVGSPGGTPVFFDARSSTDDMGIVDAWWDVNTAVDSDGDGIADNDRDAYGLTASRVYAAAGSYQARLLVRDGAGQEAEQRFTVEVRADAPPVVSAIPWQGNAQQPHPGISGKPLLLKARAWGIGPITAAWSFGDGAEATAAAVSDPRVIEATHTYIGRPGQAFQATVTITDAGGRSATSIYRIRLATDSLDTRKDIAIDRGLWALHRRFNGSGWSVYGHPATETASALQAFALHGHSPSGSLPEDPYVEDVRAGFDGMAQQLSVVSWSGSADWFTENNILPDANRQLIDCSGSPIYELGQVMDALVASGTPLWRFTQAAGGSGRAWAMERRFIDHVRDMVDMYAWGQGYNGGWRYGWNADSDNSAAQWAAIGCLAAERVWGQSVPAWVKTANRGWLDASFNGAGFGYVEPGNGEATTPSGLVQSAWTGLSRTSSRWLTVEKTIRQTFYHTPAYAEVNAYHIYGTYAFAKAMHLAEPTPVSRLDGLVDWNDDPTQGLKARIISWQGTDGTWTDHQFGIGAVLPTSWSVIMLSPDLFVPRPSFVGNRPPVAKAKDLVVPTDAGRPTATVEAYRFDNGSFDPDRNAIAFRAVPTGPYPVGVNEVTLQVTDELGLTSSALARVMVEDRENPVIQAAAVITVATDAGRATASTAALAPPATSDNVGVVSVTASTPILALGANAVTWTALDAAGNTATAAQSVVVVDRESPRLAAPAAVVTRLAAGADTAPDVTLGTPTATDNVAIATVTNDAPAAFPKGETTVTWTATDAAGNTATSIQQVVVVDARTPPQVWLTSPGDGVSFAVDSTLVLTAFAAPVATGDVLRMEFTVDGAVIGSDDQPPYRLPWTVTAAGSHTVTATAFFRTGGASPYPASLASTVHTVVVATPAQVQEVAP